MFILISNFYYLIFPVILLIFKQIPHHSISVYFDVFLFFEFIQVYYFNLLIH